jgi:ribosomal protein L12E/L44/L45/RPP1/RPP2
MRKEIADLSVRFGADGTRGLQQDIARVSTAIGKLKAVSFSAIGGLGKIGLGLGAGALAGVGALTALAAANDDYVERVSKVANATGISVEAISRLAAVARRSGLDVDDLRGALGQFGGQVADAAAGGAAAEAFERIGISADALKSNLNDPLKLLLMVAKAQKSISGAERTGILGKLFGEDDSFKMATILDELGSGSKELVDQLGNIDEAGAVVTPEDVKLSKEWNAALSEMGDVFRGLSLEIGRTVLPTVSDLVDSFAGFVRDNKQLINGNIAGAWRRVGGAIQTVIRYFDDGERAVQGTWLEPIARWLREIGDTVGTTMRGVGDLFGILGGSKRRSKEFPWMTDFAEGLTRMAQGGVGAVDLLSGGVGSVVEGLVPYLGGLPGVIDSVEASWAMLQAGFENGIGSGFLAETGKLFRILYDGATGVRDALIAISQGKPVDPQFEWVQSAVTAFGDIASLTGEFLTTLVSVTRQVIEQFGSVRDELENIFGTDITQLGLWIAFAQFSGVANTVLIAGGIILGVFGSIAGAAVLGGIALGIFIAKMAEANEWINAPFKAFDGFIDEMTGDAGRMREFWDENRRRGEEWIAQRAKMQGMTVDEFLENGRAGLAAQPQAAQPAPAAPEPDLDALLRQAQAFADGTALQQAVQFQTSIAESQRLRTETAGDAASVTQGATGTPVTIQLSPTGEAITLYAPTPDAATQLVDMVNKAKRSSATLKAPSFARPGP